MSLMNVTVDLRLLKNWLLSLSITINYRYKLDFCKERVKYFYMGNAAREKLSQLPERMTLMLTRITFCSGSVIVDIDSFRSSINKHKEYHLRFETPMCEVKIEPVEISAVREEGGYIT